MMTPPTKMILVLLCLLASSLGDETYENSSNICSRCSCSDAQTFIIDCSNQNFVNMLANWPSSKPTKAIFTGNNFRTLEKIPHSQANLEIVLSKCNIMVFDTAAFENAPNTIFIDLSYNLLTSEEVLGDKFRGSFIENTPQPIAVEHLDLSYNQIHSLKKNVFEFLPNLKWLSLKGNDFKVLDVHTQLALSSVPKLLSLNLGDNELTDLIPEAIASLKNLVELDLSKNDLDFVPEDLKLVGETLEVLVLDQNPIFEMAEETFANLTNLKTISANNLTRLKYINESTFSSTPKLVTLHLCNNSALSDIHPSAFTPNATLRELYLSNDNFTTLPSTLLYWSSLTALDLRNNPLECTCDFFQISIQLSSDLTRDANSLTCRDSSMAVLQVYSLPSDICKAKVARVIGQIRYQHISIPLAGLIVCLMVGMMAAAFMAYSRYRRFLRNGDGGNPPQVQVMYSPLLNHGP